ncbi:MAG: glycosyltransferase [Bacteroidota bacterium]
MGKKPVLIICYYWPPAGGPGVQRWLKFVKYLGEFDIEPHVFVPDNPHYPMVDHSFEKEVPEEVRVIRFPIKEPYRYAKWLSKRKTQEMSTGIISEKDPSILGRLLLFIRGNLFIPDARVGWVKPSVRFLKDYLGQNAIDTIITTGPPHSLHLIGLRLKREMDLKWIADFRDPWTTIHYHQSLRLTRTSQRKHKALEKEVLQSADTVVVTSNTTKKEFGRLTNVPVSVITNGYDAQEEVEARPDPEFSLVHIGSLLSERNPVSLWKVLSKLCNENAEFSNHFCLKLAGTVGEEICNSLESHGLLERTQLLGYVKHSEALQLQHNAQVLLLIEMDRPETRAIIPGKLFEYLRARRPIIAMGPEGSDVPFILNETMAGSYFLYAEETRLEEEILQLFDQFLRGKLEATKGPIENYSRRELTKTLVSLIQKGNSV